MSIRRPALCAAMVVLVIAAAAGCGPSAGSRRPPSPPPSTAAAASAPSSQPTAARYDPVPAGFCGHVDWDAIGSSLRLTFTRPVFVDWQEFDLQQPPGGPQPWFATCQFRMETGDGTSRSDLSVAVDVYESDEWAHRRFSDWVSTYRSRPDYDAAAIEGWWDEAVRFASRAPRGDRLWARVVHTIRHHNLHLMVLIDGSYEVEGATEEDILAVVDGLSLGLVEEVTAYLPCRTSPDAAFVPVCH